MYCLYGLDVNKQKVEIVCSTYPNALCNFYGYNSRKDSAVVLLCKTNPSAYQDYVKAKKYRLVERYLECIEKGDSVQADKLFKRLKNYSEKQVKAFKGERARLAGM